MEIEKGIEIVDLALKYKNHLIISDLQLGYEDSLFASGVLVPSINLKSIKERLEKIFSQVKDIDTVIINGDIKHEFGRITNQEWHETADFFEYILKKVKKIILIKGNHDVVLGPLAKKENIEVKEYYQLDNITILHGHKIIPNLSEVIVIGHEHPAVSFPEKPYEKFKCFLKGRWHNKTLIVMPSFTFLNEGSDVTKEQRLSPFLMNEEIGNYEVYAIEDKVYKFGKVNKLASLV